MGRERTTPPITLAPDGGPPAGRSLTSLLTAVALTIPAGTQPGRVFRLTGQGMPRFRADGYGDLYAKAKVILPTDLSEPAREAAGTFLKLTNQPEPTTRES